MLIVEDESIVAMMVEDIIGDLGHEIVGAAARLPQALAMANELAFDVAVIDVNLDGEHTYPLAAVLKARNIPFVFATGYGAAGLAEEWKGQAVVQKPFQASDLEAAIRRVTA